MSDERPIAILGANGVLARHLIPRLTATGRPVRAVVRRAEAAGPARASGADVRVADIFDAEALTAALDGAGICVNLATSLPGPSGRGDFAANDRVRSEGTPLVVEACRRAGVGRILQQSIAMLGVGGDELVDEDHVFEPQGEDVGARALRATLAMEQTIKSSDLDWLILRGGLFYGPGTGFDDAWYGQAAAGKLRLPGDGSAFVSQIHIADMAAATVRALEVWPSRRTLIVCDDAPSRWSEVFGFIAEAAGAPPPEPGGRAGFASFRTSNRRAREVLGWAPFFAHHRMGLAR